MNAVNRVINAFIFISGAGLVMMVVITVGDVLARALFTKALVGATEFCELLMPVLLTALGGSLLAGKTTKVDLVLDLLPKKVSLKIDTVVLCVCIFYCFMIGTRTIYAGRLAINANSSYVFLGVPKGPFIVLLGISFLVAAVAIVSCIQTLYKNKDKEVSVLDDPELDILSEEDKRL